MRHEMFLSRKMGDISNSFFDKFFQESPYNLKKFAKNVVENTPRNSTRFFFVTHRIAPSLLLNYHMKFRVVNHLKFSILNYGYMDDSN